MIVPAPTPTTPEAPIDLGDFYPPISPAEIRDAQRIDNTITPARLRVCLIESAITTIAALATWQAAQITLGYSKLEDIPAEKIDNTSINIHRFKRAVGCLAKAMLLERYKDFDSTNKGDKRAEQLTEPIDDHRRDHLAAIADIVGRPRITVDLI